MIFQSLQIFVHVVLTSRGVAHCGIGCDVGEEREPALDHEWRISIELVPISLGFVLYFVQVLAPSRPLCSATGWVWTFSHTYPSCRSKHANTYDLMKPWWLAGCRCFEMLVHGFSMHGLVWGSLHQRSFEASGVQSKRPLCVLWKHVSNVSRWTCRCSHQASFEGKGHFPGFPTAHLDAYQGGGTADAAPPCGI